MIISSVSLPRAAALFIAFTMLSSSVATAQTPASSSPAGATAQTTFLSTPAFARLVQGKSVVVTRSDGTWQEGTVKSLSPTGLVVSGDRFTTSVPFDQIVKVEKSSYRLRKGTLIGLGVGAGIGLFAWLSSDFEDEGPGPLLMWTGIGVGAGAIVGAAMHLSRGDRDVVYDAKRRTTTMALAPILSPTRKGLAFSMTWR